MKDISCFSKIYVASHAVDFRKQSKGLSLIVKHSMNLSPTADKSLFVFFNRSRRSVRFLYWDQTGFAMWGKVLEKDRFRWKYLRNEKYREILARELRWLLQGVDISKINFHQRVVFDAIS